MASRQAGTPSVQQAAIDSLSTEATTALEAATAGMSTVDAENVHAMIAQLSTSTILAQKAELMVNVAAALVEGSMILSSFTEGYGGDEVRVVSDSKNCQRLRPLIGTEWGLRAVCLLH